MNPMICTILAVAAAKKKGSERLQEGIRQALIGVFILLMGTTLSMGVLFVCLGWKDIIDVFQQVEIDILISLLHL